MRSHPWLADVDWSKISSLQLDPPRGPVPNATYLRSTLTTSDVGKIISTEKDVTVLAPDQQILFRE